MFSIIELQQINRYVVSFLGYSLITLAIFLIKTQSTDELKNYKKLLLITCCVDLFYITDVFVICAVSNKNGRWLFNSLTL